MTLAIFPPAHPNLFPFFLVTAISTFDSQLNMQQHWKLLIDHLYRDFIDFFLPDWMNKVDFQRPATFLSLPEQVVKARPESGQENLVLGLRFNDQKMALLLLCLEQKGYANEAFSAQLFQDFVAMREEVNFKIPTAIFTLFFNNSLPSRYEQYDYEFGQTRLQLNFKQYVIREQYLDDLWEMVNPIAFAVAACRLRLDNQKYTKGRLESKISIVNRLLSRYIQQRISLEAVLVLLQFIKGVIDLPSEAEMDFQDDTRAFMAQQSLLTEADKLSLREVLSRSV